MTIQKKTEQMSFPIFIALQTDRNNVDFADCLVDPNNDFAPTNRNARSKINDNVAQFKSTVFAVVVIA